MVSPGSTKIGTWTIRPGLGRGGLASAGLRVAGEARLRLDHCEIHGHGHLDPDRLALVARAIERHPVLEVLRGLTQLIGREDELVVRVVVHEVEIAVVAVEELDRPLLHGGARPFRPGLERALDGLAALDVAQGDADLRRSSTHLDVVVIEDLPELAVELDGDALLEFAGADHVVVDSWGQSAGHAPTGPGIVGIEPTF